MITIEKFDMKNTSFDATPSQQMQRDNMINLGIKMSKREGTYAVIVREGGNWEKYEKGSRTEWSYPNGLVRSK